ncbi:MAG: HAD family hydrolase [Ornithinibacter sp.]
MDRALQGARGVVLDLDGTLVDTTYVHTLCWWQAFRQYGRTPTMAAVHRAIGMGADRLVGHVLGPERDPGADTDVTVAHDALFAQWHDRVTPLRGACELIRWCHHVDLLVVLATSSGERDTTALLRSLGDPDFDVVVSASDVAESKPGSQIFQEALARGDLDPRHTLFVGDSVWDLQACRAVDGVGIGLECGGTSAAELRDAGAAHVFPDPAALLQALMDW